MPMPHFLLLADAIAYVEEDKNWQVVAAHGYIGADESSKRKLGKILFPISNRSREYWNYNDHGEGVKALRAISHR